MVKARHIFLLLPIGLVWAACSSEDNPPLTASSPPICTLAPTAIDFGQMLIGVKKDTTFVISNTGSGTLTGMMSVTCSEHFVVQSVGGYSLTAGQSQTVTVRYLPITADTHTCAIDMGSQFCDTLPLTGRGI